MPFVLIFNFIKQFFNIELSRGGQFWFFYLFSFYQFQLFAFLIKLFFNLFQLLQILLTCFFVSLFWVNLFSDSFLKLSVNITPLCIMTTYQFYYLILSETLKPCYLLGVIWALRTSIWKCLKSLWWVIGGWVVVVV